MKLVLVDSWTRAVTNRNVLPVLTRLRDGGADVLLVHRGSWEHDRSRPAEETLAGLRCRDIRWYGTNFIRTVLRAERPDVILLLTNTMIADRATILAARSVGARTAFLMHGRLAGAEMDISQIS